MEKLNKTEQLAEKLYKHKMHDTHEKACRVYSDINSYCSEGAYQIGLATREQQELYRRFRDKLEFIFGKEIFKHIGKL